MNQMEQYIFFLFSFVCMTFKVKPREGGRSVEGGGGHLATRQTFHGPQDKNRYNGYLEGTGTKKDKTLIKGYRYIQITLFLLRQYCIQVGTSVVDPDPHR